ncbi:MAG: DNA polymerase III subunit delta' [Aquificaceae bacterium]|nr:DNA polymerase III subunit delta' [Aquificaceae bacterium]
MRERLGKFLSGMLKSNRVPYSILLYGEEGTGKRDLAFEFATAILCLNKGYPPCGACESCKHMVDFQNRSFEELAFYGEDRRGKSVYLYLRGDHPDFVYLAPEKAEIKIDQIRGLKDFVYLSPALSGKKVILIHPAETMNPHAQNALLKVLEEPPQHTHFILVANALQRILPTVLSRSFLLQVPSYTQEELKDLTGIEDPLLLELAGGSVNMALKLKEDKELLQTARTIVEGDTLSFYKKALEVEKWEQERQRMLLKLLRNIFHKRYVEGKDLRDRRLLDMLSAGIEYLSKGIRVGLLIFQLRGGSRYVLHKGKVSGQ